MSSAAKKANAAEAGASAKASTEYTAEDIHRMAAEAETFAERLLNTDEDLASTAESPPAASAESNKPTQNAKGENESEETFPVERALEIIEGFGKVYCPLMRDWRPEGIIEKGYIKELAFLLFDLQLKQREYRECEDKILEILAGLQRIRQIRRRLNPTSILDKIVDDPPSAPDAEQGDDTSSPLNSNSKE